MDEHARAEEQRRRIAYLIGKPLHPAILMSGTDAPSQESRERLLYSIPLRRPGLSWWRPARTRILTVVAVLLGLALGAAFGILVLLCAAGLQ